MSISWDEQLKIRASDAGSNDSFGGKAAISGNYAIVGAEYNDAGGSNSGAAYIFKKSDSDETWSQQIKLVASDPAVNDRFGSSVSISGNYAIVGAKWDDDADTDSGSAYIFKKNDNDETWSQQMKLVASDAADNDRFGQSVSIYGNYAIIGAT